MLIEPLTQLLKKLKLHALLDAFERQLTDPDIENLSFEQRLALLLQHELAERENLRLAQRLRFASLPQPACLEDIDTRLPRKLDTALLSTIRDLAWIARHLNVLITGPTGVGKSFIGAALAHGACRADYSVRCFRLPRLIDELARAHAFQRRSNFLRSLAKAQLLLIDSCCEGSNVESGYAGAGFPDTSRGRRPHKSEPTEPVGQLGAVNAQPTRSGRRDCIWEDLRECGTLEIEIGPSVPHGDIERGVPEPLTDSCEVDPGLE
jgi:hypothetical protein